jgi:hypothetical protein
MVRELALKLNRLKLIQHPNLCIQLLEVQVEQDTGDAKRSPRLGVRKDLQSFSYP